MADTASAAPRTGHPKIASAVLPHALVTVFVANFCFLYGLGGRPLFDTNEGLYAEVAREMLETGNYLVPHLLGVPYLEKPPLLYWLMAASFRVLGRSEASARLACALPMLCLTMGLLVFLARHGRPRAGWLAALILSTMLPVALLSHSILFDPLLTALLSGSLLAFLHACLTGSRNWVRTGMVLLAFATLGKGLVAVILATGIGGLFILFMRERRFIRMLTDPAGLLLFALVAVPWHVAASLQQQGFAWFYLINEHILRFLGLREPHDYHSGPAYYYILRLLVMLLPWAPLLALFFRRNGAAESSADTLRNFCKAWILFPLLFFSASQAKAHYYLIVVAPAVALWAGVEIDSCMQRHAHRLLAQCLGASLGLAMLGTGLIWLVPRLAWLSPSESLAVGLATLLVSSIGWHLAVRGCRSPRFRQNWPERIVIMVGILSVPALMGALTTMHARSSRDSSQAIAQLIVALNIGDRPVFAYRDFEDVFSSLPFYMGKRIRIIDSASRDLHFGCEHAAQGKNACLSMSEFATQNLQDKVVVVSTQARLEQFQQSTSEVHWHLQQAGSRWVLFN
ncbi:ArnT family glycosyltransferase [Noviherbaspirillum massiliense]|uniref:ArnT family glycosyltransferase n=1 Tax=Noviherbaspirillum massiliense TaxID=1465823 RepID=UPI0002E4667C|nr:glycosyltransferase family 39 protein [Noviherbaspirillum massiliense]